MIGRVFPSSAIESGQTPTVPLLDTLAPLRATFGNESSDTIRVTNRRKETHGGIGPSFLGVAVFCSAAGFLGVFRLNFALCPFCPSPELVEPQGSMWQRICK
jgi:hypothetical protein